MVKRTIGFNWGAAGLGMSESRATPRQPMRGLVKSTPARTLARPPYAAGEYSRARRRRGDRSSNT